jgi:two-component system, cell cycle response regulator DivK
MSIQPLLANPARRPHDTSRRPGPARPRPYRLPPLTTPATVHARHPTRNRRGVGLVLIIDDAAHTRELYTEYLMYRGFSVVGAPDAEAGLGLVPALQPDVIVMDIAMPRLNGITATHRLKDDPRTRRIPVIMLTGYAYRAIELGALEAGADAFLTKPCLPEELELQIRALLPPADA